ncbi:DUF4192 domain-containing protein [Nonomuraea salmonea]|uniref:DUF4192 domain-containing protein n=1 Tax=Nonomuraea salmonea TaxID=46181 RepID=A0ABV5NPH8_9ACTN
MSLHTSDPHQNLPTTIRLTSPADIVALLPYLVGYHPADDLQLLTINGDEVDAVLHCPLPEPTDDLTPTVTETVQVLIRNAATQVVLIAHGPGERVTPVMDAFAPALTARGITVLDMIRYENGRCWSYLCRNPACCPPEGIPYDTTSNPAAARAVVAGLVALPDRQAFEQTLRPVQGQDRHTMTAATAAARARAETLLKDTTLDVAYWLGEGLACARRCFEHVRAARAIPADELAWLGVLLTAVSIRDITYTLSREYGTNLAQRLWTEATRRIDPAYAAAPATNLAHLAIRTGQGALARLAANRALDADPDCSFARLILTALQLGIPALTDGITDDLAQTITEHAARHPHTAKPVLPDASAEPTA